MVLRRRSYHQRLTWIITAGSLYVAAADCLWLLNWFRNDRQVTNSVGEVLIGTNLPLLLVIAAGATVLTAVIILHLPPAHPFHRQQSHS